MLGTKEQVKGIVLPAFAEPPIIKTHNEGSVGLLRGPISHSLDKSIENTRLAMHSRVICDAVFSVGLGSTQTEVSQTHFFPNAWSRRVHRLALRQARRNASSISRFSVLFTSHPYEDRNTGDYDPNFERLVDQLTVLNNLRRPDIVYIEPDLTDQHIGSVHMQPVYERTWDGTTFIHRVFVPGTTYERVVREDDPAALYQEHEEIDISDYLLAT